ncbi:MAG: DUF1801 domain-containing protein [Flavobacterium sp.]|jgi:uncharacterized protein YdhG (YjbR/CyaY superfamily)|uniref:DUF1801 domain-containing protein n=1 Tax=Flavobacterium sp. TaxID=239 RepID=UPI0022BC01D5|nr:DUF1801 domain-containing protein [Flavobacterium sp.]MCZ8090349.1 DUF1801 domain-containing protein [Flavobacterium sp.]MCZ8331576.1 DUF1801 domain-containing protein [Flavobacterium sp.]
MQSTAKTPSEYVDSLPDERKNVIENIRKTILDNLPKGFEETISYGMLGYVVPHSIYPSGYHCDPKTPLPFISVASQKNFIAVYHMGIYADETLLNWFVAEYPKHCKTKLDMGKSCIRFKKVNDIPLDLLGQLVTKMTVQDWISLYENNLKQ